MRRKARPQLGRWSVRNIIFEVDSKSSWDLVSSLNHARLVTVVRLVLPLLGDVLLALHGLITVHHVRALIVHVGLRLDVRLPVVKLHHVVRADLLVDFSSVWIDLIVIALGRK